QAQGPSAGGYVRDRSQSGHLDLLPMGYGLHLSEADRRRSGEVSRVTTVAAKPVRQPVSRTGPRLKMLRKEFLRQRLASWRRSTGSGASDGRREGHEKARPCGA